jgi:metallophosphoesterase (TIGR00282 family)
MLRPMNYPAGTPGSGFIVLESKKCKVAVVNLQGRTFMNQQLDNPFPAIAACVEELRQETPVIFVDFHAEATSEKVAMGWHLDGKVTAVVGTHTHVQTADERILPGGTACLSDVGMTGPHDGVIGMDKTIVIARFMTGLHVRFEPATGDPRLNGVVITADPATGRASAIARIQLTEAQLQQITDQVSAVPVV